MKEFTIPFTGLDLIEAKVDNGRLIIKTKEKVEKEERYYIPKDNMRFKEGLFDMEGDEVVCTSGQYAYWRNDKAQSLESDSIRDVKIPHQSIVDANEDFDKFDLIID